MSYRYPTPLDLGIKIPKHIIESIYCKGFRHALIGGKITRSEQLRRSFRHGYKAGKLYLKQLRHQQGISEFPILGKIKFTLYIN